MSGFSSDFMALKKLIHLPSSLAVEYHRISALFVHDVERVMEIHLQSFVDEETRREVEELAGGATRPKWQPASNPVVSLGGADFTALFGPGVPDYPCKADLYAFLKTRPEFAGAVDV